MDYKSFIKRHQQKIVLTAAFLLVVTLGILFGRMTAPKFEIPEIRVEQAYSATLNNTENPGIVQSASVDKQTVSCSGQIKGSSSLIYHLPGGDFYDKVTKPIRCFDTEAQAQATGFRKSSR